MSVADFSANPDLQSGNIGTGVGAALWIIDPEDPHTILPHGAIGEILMEGPIVGRGYLSDPERTAAAFLSDLRWARQQASSSTRRFYRSGDLGKANGDGSITFFGRRDDQVKVSRINACN